MASWIEVPTKNNAKGKTRILDGLLPFEIKRVFFIQEVPIGAIRGGHRHFKTRQVLVCLQGSCTVEWNNQMMGETLTLQSGGRGLLLEPEDYHVLRDFESNCVIAVMASTPYDPADYIESSYS